MDVKLDDGDALSAYVWGISADGRLTETERADVRRNRLAGRTSWCPRDATKLHVVEITVFDSGEYKVFCPICGLTDQI